MSSNCLVFHTSAFLFLIILSTESSYSYTNGPCLMSNCLLLILVIGPCVTFGAFPSKFSKCCFQTCIRSCWLVAFSLAFAVLFLLLTPFAFCHAILVCLSSTKFLILLIWFCIHSVCSFMHMLAKSFCAFLSFRALVLVGFLEAVFTVARFFLTANVSHGILGLALCLVGMHYAATFKWALTKFSYSSFGICVSIFSYSVSNLFLSVNAYSSLISLLLSKDQSQSTMVVVRIVFLRRLSRVFAVTIRWSDDTPSKEEYASQFKSL